MMLRVKMLQMVVMMGVVVERGNERLLPNERRDEKSSDKGWLVLLRTKGRERTYLFFDHSAYSTPSLDQPQTSERHSPTAVQPASHQQRHHQQPKHDDERSVHSAPGPSLLPIPPSSSSSSASHNRCTAPLFARAREGHRGGRGVFERVERERVRVELLAGVTGRRDDDRGDGDVLM
jgi:hypothetical protein